MLVRVVRHPVARLSNDELAWLRRFVAGTPGLRQGLIFTPSTTIDPYLHDGAPPLLGLQLYFDDIAVLEAQLAPDGYLQGLVARDALPSLAEATATQQAMLVRRFEVPDPIFCTLPGECPCTYLVAYEGEAEDLNAWHSHYIGRPSADHGALPWHQAGGDLHTHRLVRITALASR